MSAPNDKPERKANRRGAARLAAVQALYQMDVAGTGIADILTQFESHWIGREVEGEQYLPAEAAYFRDLVKGVIAGQRTLDPLIDAALEGSWPLKRVETIIRAPCCGRALSNSTRSRMCRLASSSPNMSMWPTPSSSATKSAWSIPCSTSWPATSAPPNLIKSRAEAAPARVAFLARVLAL